MLQEIVFCKVLGQVSIQWLCTPSFTSWKPHPILRYRNTFTRSLPLCHIKEPAHYLHQGHLYRISDASSINIAHVPKYSPTLYEMDASCFYIHFQNTTRVQFPVAQKRARREISVSILNAFEY